MRFRNRQQGNTLAEYALPMALVVVASGVIAASVNIETLLPNFFAEASGATVNGSNVVAQASGTCPGCATGTGTNGGLGALNGKAGETAQSLGLEGLEEPVIEVSGGMGTQVALAQMNSSGVDIDAEGDDEDYEASSTYVAMVKDLALTTASADEATEQSDASGDTGQSNAILDEYASAVAAKGNAIQQYAFANLLEIMRHGGVVGLQQVDDTVDESADDFEAGQDDQADEQGETEEAAVEDDAQVDTAQEDTQLGTGAAQFDYRLNLYSNTQYTPIEDEVFTQWREANLDAKYGTHVTIWALDYEGSVSVLQQSWNGFLDGVN